MKYQLPETPETENTICMQITIPDTREYRVAFWTSLYHLGKWSAWEQDGTDKAKRAAAVWKPLIMEARERYEAGLGCEEGECDMQIRQNPDNLCQLQAREGTGEWETIADFSTCANPPTTSMPTLPYMTPSGGKPADQLNAERIVTGLHKLSYLYAYYWNLNEATARGAIKSYFPTLSAFYLDPVLISFYNDFHSQYASQAAAYAGVAGADWDGMRDWIVCENDVPFENTGWWLQTLSDKLFDFLSDTSDELFQMLNSAALAIMGSEQSGLHYLWNPPTGGSAITLGDLGCEWVENFDFTVSAGLWSVVSYYDGDEAQGEWISGVGFRSTFVEALSGVSDERVTIRRLFDQSRITSVTIWYTLETPFHAAANGAVLFGSNEATFSMSGGDQQEGVAGDEYVSEVKAIINGGLWADPYPPYNPSGQKCYITAAQVTGIGENPFT
jgi:hypothetical protein